MKLDDYWPMESIPANERSKPRGPPKSPLRVALRRSPGNGYRSSLGGGRESHRSKVILRIENDLFPWLRSRPITAIEADELLETLRRIEARGALGTALTGASAIAIKSSDTPLPLVEPGEILRLIFAAPFPRPKAGTLRALRIPTESRNCSERSTVTRGVCERAVPCAWLPSRSYDPANCGGRNGRISDLAAAEWRIPAEIMKHEGRSDHPAFSAGDGGRERTASADRWWPVPVSTASSHVKPILSIAPGEKFSTRMSAPRISIPPAPGMRWGTDLTGTWTTREGGVSVMLTVDRSRAFPARMLTRTLRELEKDG